MASNVSRIKLIIERTEHGYIGYPVGMKGAVVGQGETYEEALRDLRSAVQCHVDIFGPAVLEDAEEVQEVLVAEAEVLIPDEVSR